jgi:hypothetical protein
MAEIVNLRQARKRRARVEKEARAAENRVQFGRTKVERERTGAQKDLNERRLDGHKRDEDKP